MIKSKRSFIKNIGLGIISLPFFRGVRADYKPKVVIIGGGFGGGTCLRYLMRFSELIDITLIEKDTEYYTCPFSNYVLGGFRNMDENKFYYKKIDPKRVRIINKNASFIDSEKKKILLVDKEMVSYDRLVLSPGISFKWDGIAGYNYLSNLEHPHGWSGKYANIISKKIDALQDKATIVISAPEYPYRCPPAPYERASLIAYNLKKKGKKFKILILDNKNSFTKKELFLEAWEKLYPESIEWIPKDKGGRVKQLESKKKIVHTYSGEKVKADFINIIPEQKCSDIFQNSYLTDNDWIRVNPKTFELHDHKYIHAIADSIDAGDMPKSAFSANSQGKVCAENIINLILERPVSEPVFFNTCYSLAAPEYGFSISSWYRVNQTNDKIVSLGSKESPLNVSKKIRKQEYFQSIGWYKSVTKDLFG